MHSAIATKQQPDRGGAFGRQMKEWRDVRRMSQLDLSLAAEVSSRHVSFVETGRSKPSREMVLRLAQALDMPLGDRNELLGAAGYAPAYRARAMDEASMAPMNRALEHMLSSHEPYPAVVFDRLWNLKASNGAAMQLFGGLAQADETPNGMRMVLAPGPMRDMIENWNEVAYATLTRLRRELAQSGDDPDLVALWEEAKGYAQGIDLAAGTRDEPVLTLRLRFGDIVLSTFSTIAAFGTAQDIGLRELSIEHIFPADAETEAFFRQAV
ncbi:MAG: helix-turn-helix transcriptional regulator [Alphaproteobacteria bacterium]|nr:helix-turn-helix transcriptional regulator [Alphaproteobacteria bacterium]